MKVSVKVSVEYDYEFGLRFNAIEDKCSKLGGTLTNRKTVISELGQIEQGIIEEGEIDLDFVFLSCEDTIQFTTFLASDEFKNVYTRLRQVKHIDENNDD